MIPFTTIQAPTQDETYEVLGFCDGTVVRGFNVARQFLASVKSVFGANLEELETIVMRLRHDAIKRCLESAKEMGADEVIGMNIDVSDISQPNSDSLTVVYVYGTAIRYHSSTSPRPRKSRTVLRRSRTKASSPTRGRK